MLIVIMLGVIILSVMAPKRRHMRVIIKMTPTDHFVNLLFCGAMTLGITTFSIMSVSIMTLSITIVSIMIVSITTVSIMTFSIRINKW